MDESTQQQPTEAAESLQSHAAKTLAESMTPQERAERAANASRARWGAKGPPSVHNVLAKVIELFGTQSPEDRKKIIDTIIHYFDIK